MKYFTLLLTVLLLGLVGCSDTSLVGADLEAQQASDAESMAKNTVKYVPFYASGYIIEQFVFVPPSEEVFPFDSFLEVVCEPIPILEVWQIAEVTATHMGAVTIYSNLCFDTRTATYHGKSVWVASNGDYLYDEFVGELTDQGSISYVSIPIPSGTGRFENASIPEPWLAVGVGDFSTITGSISSVGSSK